MEHLGLFGNMTLVFRVGLLVQPAEQFQAFVQNIVQYFVVVFHFCQTILGGEVVFLQKSLQIYDFFCTYEKKSVTLQRIFWKKLHFNPKIIKNYTKKNESNKNYHG